MPDGSKDPGLSEDIYCPVVKHKIHCSQLEGTEASELPEERRYEFCLTKCFIYKKHYGAASRHDGMEKVIYQDGILRIAKWVDKNGFTFKIEIKIDDVFCKSWEEDFTDERQAIESVKRKYKHLYT